jgi:hypothetical protein
LECSDLAELSFIDVLGRKWESKDEVVSVITGDVRTEQSARVGDVGREPSVRGMEDDVGGIPAAVSRAQRQSNSHDAH